MKFSVEVWLIHEILDQPSTNLESTCRFFLYKVPTKNC